MQVVELVASCNPASSLFQFQLELLQVAKQLHESYHSFPLIFTLTISIQRS